MRLAVRDPLNKVRDNKTRARLYATTDNSTSGQKSRYLDRSIDFMIHCCKRFKTFELKIHCTFQFTEENRPFFSLASSVCVPYFPFRFSLCFLADTVLFSSPFVRVSFFLHHIMPSSAMLTEPSPVS